SRVAVANVLKRWIEGSLVLGSVSSPYFECERLIESGTGGASASSGSVLATSSRRSKTVSLPAQPATIISVVQLNFVRVSTAVISRARSTARAVVTLDNSSSTAARNAATSSHLSRAPASIRSKSKPSSSAASRRARSMTSASLTGLAVFLGLRGIAILHPSSPRRVRHSQPTGGGQWLGRGVR